MASWRRIQVNGDHYQWCFGRASIVIRRSNRTVLTVPQHEVKGVSVEEWERAWRKGYGSITPADVEKVIKERLYV